MKADFQHWLNINIKDYSMCHCHKKQPWWDSAFNHAQELASHLSYKPDQVGLIGMHHDGKSWLFQLRGNTNVAIIVNE